ncbi:C40 family peptidase [Leptobacterium sp. I13]|uniref:C40 family peptidase n=1 Tax=Leptobacterium meishanense TaxID=3128904 RepID=UPI0030EBAC10
MKTILPVFILAFLVLSCKSTKKTVTVKPKTETISTKKTRNTFAAPKAPKIIGTALSFNGIPYLYGGTTSKGMDCSGLIYTSFKENNVNIQRTSSLMATEGKRIKVKEVKKGDLLFFNTNKNHNNINHVGLVVSANGNDIKFIHATTSRGVLVSSLNEGYWSSAFVEARRVL